MKSSAGLAGRGLTGAALPAGECGGRAETGLGAVRKGTGSVGKAGQGRAGQGGTFYNLGLTCACMFMFLCGCVYMRVSELSCAHTCVWGCVHICWLVYMHSSVSYVCVFM